MADSRLWKNFYNTFSIFVQFLTPRGNNKEGSSDELFIFA